MEDKYFYIIGVGVILVLGLAIWFGANSGQAYSILVKDSVSSVCVKDGWTNKVTLGLRERSVGVSGLAKDGFTLIIDGTKVYWPEAKDSITAGGLTVVKNSVNLDAKEVCLGIQVAK